MGKAARDFVFLRDSSIVDLRLIDGHIGRSRRYYGLMWSTMLFIG